MSIEDNLPTELWESPELDTSDFGITFWNDGCLVAYGYEGAAGIELTEKQTKRLYQAMRKHYGD